MRYRIQDCTGRPRSTWLTRENVTLLAAHFRAGSILLLVAQDTPDSLFVVDEAGHSQVTLSAWPDCNPD